MALLDLPMELLVQILEEVGGSHLRRGDGIRRLALCRKWYAAARPIYLAGVGAASIKLHGFNIDDIRNRLGSSSLRPLMYKNTRRLHIRLLGHFWDERTAADPNALNEAPFDTAIPESQLILECWRDQTLNFCLCELFDDLRHFSTLEDLTFEASSDWGSRDDHALHWNYLYGGTIQRLLTNLPILHDLSNFTLDLCGLETGLICDYHSPPIHLCSLLSHIVPQIQTVRLRIPEICPDLYRVPKLESSRIRIQTLTIKLYLPFFANSRGPHVKACPALKDTFNKLHLHQHMTRGADGFLRRLARGRKAESTTDGAHGMTGFRVSTVYERQAGRVTVLDCLNKRMLSTRRPAVWNHDDGTPSWFEFCDRDIVDKGPLRP